MSRPRGTDSRHQPTPPGPLDEVFEQQRALLFPPGTLAFAFANVALIVGCSTLIPMIAFAALPDERDAVIVAVASIGLVVICLIIPPLFVVRGRSGGRAFMSGLASAGMLLCACAAIATLLGTFDGRWLALAIGFSGFAIARTLLRSRRYLEFATFFSLKREHAERVRRHLREVAQRN